MLGHSDSSGVQIDSASQLFFFLFCRFILLSKSWKIIMSTKLRSVSRLIEFFDSRAAQTHAPTCHFWFRNDKAATATGHAKLHQAPLTPTPNHHFRRTVNTDKKRDNRFWRTIFNYYIIQFYYFFLFWGYIQKGNKRARCYDPVDKRLLVSISNEPGCFWTIVITPRVSENMF